MKKDEDEVRSHEIINTEEGLPMKIMKFMGLPKPYRQTLYNEMVDDVEVISSIPSDTASSFYGLVSWLCGKNEDNVRVPGIAEPERQMSQEVLSIITPTNENKFAKTDTPAKISSVESFASTEPNRTEENNKKLSITTSKNLTEEISIDNLDLNGNLVIKDISNYSRQKAVCYSETALYGYGVLEEEENDHIKSVTISHELSIPNQKNVAPSETDMYACQCELTDMVRPQVKTDNSIPNGSGEGPIPENPQSQSHVLECHKSLPDAFIAGKILTLTPISDALASLETHQSFGTGKSAIKEVSFSITPSDTDTTKAKRTTSEVQMQLNDDMKTLEDIVKKLYKSLNKKGPLTIVANFKPKENGELALDLGNNNIPPSRTKSDTVTSCRKVSQMSTDKLVTGTAEQPSEKTGSDVRDKQKNSIKTAGTIEPISYREDTMSDPIFSHHHHFSELDTTGQKFAKAQENESEFEVKKSQEYVEEFRARSIMKAPMPDFTPSHHSSAELSTTGRECANGWENFEVKKTQGSASRFRPTSIMKRTSPSLHLHQYSAEPEALEQLSENKNVEEADENPQHDDYEGMKSSEEEKTRPIGIMKNKSSLPSQYSTMLRRPSVSFAPKPAQSAFAVKPLKVMENKVGVDGNEVCKTAVPRENNSVWDKASTANFIDTETIVKSDVGVGTEMHTSPCCLFPYFKPPVCFPTNKMIFQASRGCQFHAGLGLQNNMRIIKQCTSQNNRSHVIQPLHAIHESTSEVSTASSISTVQTSGNEVEEPAPKYFPKLRKFASSTSLTKEPRNPSNTELPHARTKVYIPCAPASQRKTSYCEMFKEKMTQRKAQTVYVDLTSQGHGIQQRRQSCHHVNYKNSASTNQTVSEE